uniref:Uncharacterized protein n=1 Tax=Lotharella globosa TaxID=91324 RepID=A0A7S3Z2V2_9EUKA
MSCICRNSFLVYTWVCLMCVFAFVFLQMLWKFQEKNAFSLVQWLTNRETMKTKADTVFVLGLCMFPTVAKFSYMTQSSFQRGRLSGVQERVVSPTWYGQMLEAQD